jgi:3-methyladenine DNA glycosylase/8-oxoguanine DNA glycosylase
MAFTKGTSGNRAGRRPGTPNKATTAAREVIGAALSGTDAAKLAAQLNTLIGKDFIDAYVKLAEFVSPKLQRTALAAEADTAGPMRVTLNLGRPHEPSVLPNSLD